MADAILAISTPIGSKNTRPLSSISSSTCSVEARNHQICEITVFFTFLVDYPELKLVFFYSFSVRDVYYRYPGTQLNLLNGVSFLFPEKNWKAQTYVVKLLRHLKRELIILIVSHDLKELAALVDLSWRMEMGGFWREECLKV
ncbi:hypothetical protein SLA2020_022360 [Shorea laevis]